jgi:hypothetical protein
MYIHGQKCQFAELTRKPALEAGMVEYTVPDTPPDEENGSDDQAMSTNLPDPNQPILDNDGVPVSLVGDGSLPAADSDLPIAIRPSFPWRPVLLIGGLVVVLIVGIIFVTQIKQVTPQPTAIDLDTPDHTVQAFYSALNSKDYVGAQKYVDTQAIVLPNALSYAESIRAKVSDLAKQTLGADVDLQVTFQDLTFEISQQSIDQAVVHVRGRVHLYDARQNNGILLPYDNSHTLILRQHTWYMMSS